MNSEKLMSLIQRALFAGSLLVMAGALLERIVNVYGYTILRLPGATPGRLLEIGVILLIVLITLLLRQVRDELKHAHQ